MRNIQNLCKFTNRNFQKAYLNLYVPSDVKFILSKKATKIDEIFTVDLTRNTQCQIGCEDFVNFCGLLRKHELYKLVTTKIEVTLVLRSL